MHTEHISKLPFRKKYITSTRGLAICREKWEDAHPGGRVIGGGLFEKGVWTLVAKGQRMGLPGTQRAARLWHASGGVGAQEHALSGGRACTHR